MDDSWNPPDVAVVEAELEIASRLYNAACYEEHEQRTLGDIDLAPACHFLMERRGFRFATAQRTVGGERLAFQVVIDAPLMVSGLVADAMEGGPESIENHMNRWQPDGPLYGKQARCREEFQQLAIECLAELVRQFSCRNLPAEALAINVKTMNVEIFLPGQGSGTRAGTRN